MHTGLVAPLPGVLIKAQRLQSPPQTPQRISNSILRQFGLYVQKYLYIRIFKYLSKLMKRLSTELRVPRYYY